MDYTVSKNEDKNRRIPPFLLLTLLFLESICFLALLLALLPFYGWFSGHPNASPDGIAIGGGI